MRYSIIMLFVKPKYNQQLSVFYFLRLTNLFILFGFPSTAFTNVFSIILFLVILILTLFLGHVLLIILFDVLKNNCNGVIVSQILR